MISLFRRIYTKDIKGTCISAMDTPIVVPVKQIQDRRTFYALDERNVYEIHLLNQIKITNEKRLLSNAENQRNSFLYSIPRSMSEDFRSKMKYLTSKTRPLDASMINIRPSQRSPIPNVPSDDESASLVSDDGEEGFSRGQSACGCDAISTTMTRNATARVITRPPADFTADAARSVKERVQCPKPNSMSPYAKHSNADSDGEATTLRNHYTKVLLQPYKPFEVIFPTIPNPAAGNPIIGRKKNRSLDQYLGGRSPNQSRLMAANVNNKVMGNTTQNRNLQSDTKPSPMHKTPDSDYRYVKKSKDNRPLDICQTDSDKPISLESPEELRKKHVEVVRMEVVKLDRKVRSKSRHKDIKQELETVLNEALAQAKVYEKNITDAHKFEESYDNETDARCSPNLLHLKRPYPRTSRSCHSSVVLKKEDAPNARNAYDGKHCYNVLKQSESGSDLNEVRRTKSEKIDVSMALTDLNAYEDVKNSQDSPPNLVAEHISKVDLRTASLDRHLTRLERDYKIAQKQHNQRVLDVIDFVNDMKVK